MDKRTFLAIVLSLIVILTWQVFFAKKPPPKQPEPTQQETPVAGKPAVKETARAQFTPSQTKTVLSQKVAGSEKDISVVTPLFTAIFTTKGGSLKSYKLKEYRTTLDSTSDLVELVHRYGWHAKTVEHHLSRIKRGYSSGKYIHRRQQRP